MIYPTTEEEKRAFYQEVLPGFLEYLRSHMSAIEQVELATVTDGIVSFPATQVLGGVQKTVRVPLSIITAVIDADLEQVKEAARYAQEQGDYAKAEGDYADEQGNYASEQGDYAKEQGNAALAAKNIVTTWYNPFRDNVEQWAADAASAENQRIAAENTRKSQETARQNAETARASAETARANAETQRNLAELDRIEAELERISKELERKAAEAQRQQKPQRDCAGEKAHEGIEEVQDQQHQHRQGQDDADMRKNSSQHQDTSSALCASLQAPDPSYSAASMISGSTRSWLGWVMISPR